MSARKTFRYYWWLTAEFFKKHAKLISLSFFISFIAIIGIISISPYLEVFFSNQKQIIGLVGNYDFNNVPEEIVNKISNGLVFVNDKGEIIPTVSTSWEIKSRETEYRFHLRSNLMWSDGKRFDARDINYQFKDVASKIINSTTIDFILKKPLAIFPSYLQKPILRYPLIGLAGLYKVNQIKQNFGYFTSISLEPNKNDLPIITYKFYNTETQLINAYKRGEITEMQLTKKSIANSFANWKNTKITKTIDYTRLLTLFFNHDSPPIKEKDIRNAISMAIDLGPLANFGQLAKGPVPPISWAYNPNLKNPVYDSDSAGKVIKKSFTASQSAQLNFVTYYDYFDIADQIVNNLKQAGLPVNLSVSNYEKPSNFDFLLAFWKVPPDPDQYYFWHSTQTQGNIGNYKNVRIDKLLEDGRSTINVDERKKVYFDFQRIMQDDPAALFLYYPYVYTIKRK